MAERIGRSDHVMGIVARALASALTDGGVTMAEWVTVASATLIAFAGVWSIPNATVKDHAAEHEAK